MQQVEGVNSINSHHTRRKIVMWPSNMRMLLGEEMIEMRLHKMKPTVLYTR